MRGRLDGCKDNLGGVSYVYFMDFKKYPKHRISLNAERTQILAFPVTIIYEAEIRTSSNFDQQFQDGAYSQSIEIAFKKDSLSTLRELKTLSKKELRLIVKDSLGRFQMMGMYNGVKVSGFNRTTGGAKADFNGYNVTFEATEELAAPFIDSLENTGFIPEPGEGLKLFTADNAIITVDNAIISIDTLTI
jgi:hypothetical protein